MARTRGSWSIFTVLLLAGAAHAQTEQTFKSFGMGVEWCDGSTFGGGFSFTTPTSGTLPLSYSGLTPCDPAYGNATTSGTLAVSSSTLKGTLDALGGRFQLDTPMTLTLELSVSWPVPPNCIRSGIDCSNANLFAMSNSINQGTTNETCQAKSASQATVVAGQTVNLRVSFSCQVNALTKRDDEPSGFVTLFEFGFRWQKGLSVVYPLHVYGLAVYTAGPATGRVADVTPEVAPNSTWPGAPDPLTVSIAGSGFVDGSKVSMGDVKVLATRFKSSTLLEADLSGLQDLPEGRRDVTVEKPDKTKIVGQGLFFVSGLSIAPLEINQGVPMGFCPPGRDCRQDTDCTASTPCVANKDTVVRVRLACNGAACLQGKPALTGLLRVTTNGTPIPGSPFVASPQTFTRLRQVGEKLEPVEIAYAFDALNYYFDRNRDLSGTLEFSFEVDPRSPGSLPARNPAPDTDKSLVRRLGGQVFTRSGADRAIRIAVAVDPGITPRSPNFAQATRVLDLFGFARLAYPISRDLFTAERVPCAATVANDDEEIAWPTMTQCWTALSSQNPGQYTHLFLFVQPPNFLSPGVSNCSNGFTGFGCRSPLSLVTFYGPDTTATIAHELGHHFRLGDTYKPPSATNSLNGPDADTCQAYTDGCAVENQHFDLELRQVSVGTPPIFPDKALVKRDFMGNAPRAQRWVDRRTWDYLYGRLRTRSRASLATGDWIVVSGLARQDGASFLPFARFNGSVEPTESVEGGAYTLAILGSSGAPLASTKLDLAIATADRPRPATRVPFTAILPFPAGAAQVTLSQGSTVVASRNVSRNAPSVSLTAPGAGTSLGATATISWTASDADGDPLTYDVLSSRDGQTWVPIATGLTATRFDWDTSETAGSDTTRVRVVAMDGVHSTSATSGALRLATKAPRVGFVTPLDGAVVAPGQPLTIEVYGADPEDGSLPGTALSVASNRSGSLGTGGTLVVSSLAVGVHTLTVSGTDTDGNRSTESITVTVFDAATATPNGSAFVPIVLSTAGVGSSFFTSELTLTNRGNTNAVAQLVYTAAIGIGSGTALVSLPAGQQLIVPDAIATLRSLGVPLPESGNLGGTLRVRFFGLSSATAGSATIRTTTAVAQGRAGLSYPAIPPASLTGAVYLCGLRQTATDRSNLALMNAGADADGSVTLRVTVTSGDPNAPTSRALPDVTLGPGGFTQISQVLASNGLSLTNGYAKVERVSGSAPYYAYAVINDQANSDGSFVPPSPASGLSGKTGITLPVAVEAGPFTTELVLTNFGTSTRTVRLAFVADAVSASGNEAAVNVTLRAGEQRVLPSFVAFLREQGAPGVGSGSFAGSVFLTVPSGDVNGLFLGARTSAPGGGGRYGLFYAGVPYGSAATSSAWLYGLQQNAENRTNVAIVNTGEVDGGPNAFKIELYDGATGMLANVVDVSVGARRFTQLSSILKTYAPSVSAGYAKVTRTAGSNPFVTYAVVNDGGVPGERSDDGAFVAMDVEGSSMPQNPALSVSTSALDFGSVTAGQSKDLSLTVRNAGGGTLTGTAVTSSPFGVVSGASLSLGAGLSQTITVRFTPPQSGGYGGTLLVTTNAGTATVALGGESSTASSPRLEVTPTTLDFGPVTVGATKDLDLTVRNAGTANLTVSGAAAVTPFSVTTSLPFTLAAGASRAVTVRFAPSGTATVSSTLTLASNDPATPTASVSLTGRGASGQATTEVLSTDDGTPETGVYRDGLLVVNRLTPTRYPATLQTIRLFFQEYSGVGNPTGAQIRLVVFTDPTGLGRPPAGVTPLMSAPLTLPTIPAAGTPLEYTIDGGPSVSSGDLYVGFLAPSPGRGVVFSADTNGLQLNRAWYSTDSGSTFLGPLGVQNQQGGVTPVNILIRATVSIPAARPSEEARVGDASSEN